MTHKTGRPNMKLMSFLFSYSKMRLSVMLGLRKTSYPLNMKWWWQHPNYFKLGDIHIN